MENGMQKKKNNNTPANESSRFMFAAAIKVLFLRCLFFPFVFMFWLKRWEWVEERYTQKKIDVCTDVFVWISL